MGNEIRGKPVNISMAERITTLDIPLVDEWLYQEEGEGETSPHIPNTLAKALGRRPSREDVGSKMILKSQVQALSETLLWKAIGVRLDAALARRPPLQKLQDMGILPPPVAEALSQRTESEVNLDKMEKGETCEELGRAEDELLQGPSALRSSVSLLPASSLNDWLEEVAEDGEVSPHVPNKINRFFNRRPSRDMLLESGILKTQEMQVSDHLARKSIIKQLDDAIQRRPSGEQLIAAGIISPTQILA